MLLFESKISQSVDGCIPLFYLQKPLEDSRLEPQQITSSKFGNSSSNPPPFCSMVHFQGCISSSSTHPIHKQIHEAAKGCLFLSPSYAIFRQGVVGVFSKVKEAKFQTTKKNMVTKCQKKTQQTQNFPGFFPVAFGHPSPATPFLSEMAPSSASRIMPSHFSPRSFFCQRFLRSTDLGI